MAKELTETQKLALEELQDVIETGCCPKITKRQQAKELAFIKKFVA